MMISSKKYLMNVTNYILSCRNSKHRNKCAEMISHALISGNIIHTFGCGHSALVAAEPIYRSGSFAMINFIGLLPGPSGALAATSAESQLKWAKPLIRNALLREGDVLIVISHSGASPLILKMASCARRLGARVIAVTRSANTPLAKQADGILTTRVPKTDVMKNAPLGPMSSILSISLLHAVFIDALAVIKKAGVKPHIFKSIHIRGGIEHNRPIIKSLIGQIPCWSDMKTVGFKNDKYY